MKSFYKIILSYKGTRYHGWQNQTTQSETIQNHVEKVIAKIVNYQNYQVIGASRTDSGVHARGQALKVVLPREISPHKLVMGMNSKLPVDIRVVSCEFCHEKFNVNQDVDFKEYHYYFSIAQPQNALNSEMIYPYPEKLDLDLMKQACQLIQGEHNFESFSYPGPTPPKPYRHISQCQIKQTSTLTLETPIYYFTIKGRGFLRHMVRYLMGAVWDIGAGKLTLDQLKKSLGDGNKHGPRTKAPALGLHLVEITY